LFFQDSACLKEEKKLQFNIQGSSYFASGVVHDLIFIAAKKYRQIELFYWEELQRFRLPKMIQGSVTEFLTKTDQTDSLFNANNSV
jgi:hypothetical protein